MRGISFELPNLYDSFLSKILCRISVENYNWIVYDNETYINVEEPLFHMDRLNGQEFSGLIHYPSYYIYYANIQAYRPGDKVVELIDYEDFVKSTCEIALYITDSIYVEIYCKQKAFIDTIKENAEKNSFTKIKYITDENDGRTKFND